MRATVVRPLLVSRTRAPDASREVRVPSVSAVFVITRWAAASARCSATTPGATSAGLKALLCGSVAFGTKGLTTPGLNALLNEGTVTVGLKPALSDARGSPGAIGTRLLGTTVAVPTPLGPKALKDAPPPT